MTNDQLFKIKQLMEGGILDTAILEIQKDIALDIIHQRNFTNSGLHISSSLRALFELI